MTGVIAWITGLPASGKSTLAERTRARLPPTMPCVVLDSDVIRAALGAASYESTARDAFYETLAELALVIARQGLVVLVAATAPKRAHRERIVGRGVPTIEAWVRTEREECARRDPKGLYMAAARGDVPQLPGGGVRYEPPVSPDVVADGGRDDEAAAAIARKICERATR